MWNRYLLGALLAFGAINTFAGGYYGLSGAPGVPLDWLAGSPFKNYFIPSLILLVVVGGAFSFAAVAVFARSRLARVSAFIGGIIVLVWIAVQLAIIGYVSWMQPATLFGGVLVLVLAWLLPARDQGSWDCGRRRSGYYSAFHNALVRSVRLQPDPTAVRLKADTTAL